MVCVHTHSARIRFDDVCLCLKQKQSVKVVVKAIGAVPEKDAGSVIDSLTDDEKDILMKYLYRGLEEAESCNQLLKWHGILAEKAGNGCIMRALSETTRL